MLFVLLIGLLTKSTISSPFLPIVAEVWRAKMGGRRLGKIMQIELGEVNNCRLRHALISLVHGALCLLAIGGFIE